MKTLVVSAEKGDIIAVHEPSQQVSADMYEAFGTVIVGNVPDGVFRRGDPAGYEWSDRSEMLGYMKDMATVMVGDDEAAKTKIEKARNLAALRTVIEAI